MDPNETLRRLREYVKHYNNGSLADAWATHATDVIELFEALDQWMSRGGFSPWETPKRDIGPGTFAYRKVQD